MNPLAYKVLLVISLFFFYPSSSGFASQENEIATQVAKALNKGSARDVARHFGNTVDLKLPGNEGTYSRNQAELILRNFFSRNPVQSFTVQHQGPSRDGSIYVIGVFSTTDGKTFRAYFLCKNISERMVLHLLQMDEQ